MVTVGCARVGLASDADAASVWNVQVTPAEETPFQMFVLICSCRAMVRNGFGDSCAVRMIDGSMKRSCYSRPWARGAGHFCQPLHVSVKARPYLCLREASRTWSLNLLVDDHGLIVISGKLGC
jgi:hypothetical protein